MEPTVSLCPNPVQTDVRNLSELPDDVLMKILSLLPTKEAAATSVLSKRWCRLWKQQDVDCVELCRDCSIEWIAYTFMHHPKHRHELRPTYRQFFDRFGEMNVVEVPPPPPEKVGFVSLMSFLTGEARLLSGGCAECKGRIHAPRKVTIYMLGGEWRKTEAFIWTKLEEKQEIQIDYVIRRKTTVNYCLSLEF